VEEIENVYLESWKLGLKCIAIYRDGCKRSQPLSSSSDAKKEEKAASDALAALASVAPAGAVRKRLPDERQSITHKFDIQGHEGYITVGLYDDGQPGEIFLTMAKEGSTISGLMDAFATQTSLALQYGVPLRAMVNKFSHMRFEPSGFTRNQEIPIAKSLVDYLFRWLASKFLDLDEQEAVGIIKRESPVKEAAPAPVAEIAAPAPATAPPTTNGGMDHEIKLVVKNPISDGSPRLTFMVDRDAPGCPDCGAITVRSGACYKCMNCGSTTGCS
jgi:ribonucleoside-diphosphate reductase alpha chain